MIVALNDGCDSRRIYRPASDAPLIVIRELTNNEAVILIEYEI